MGLQPTCRAVSTTSAAPSAGTVPLPALENGRQTPSAAQIMPSAASIGASGLREVRIRVRVRVGVRVRVRVRVRVVVRVRARVRVT